MSEDTYPIIHVEPGAAEITETMGSKPKFWYTDPNFGVCLFKQGRPGTGEDWAEKVASELCEALGLPHASYELAEWDGQAGIVTPIILTGRESLLHGNELMGEVFAGYPGDERYRVSDHTLSRVLSIMRAPNIQPPAGTLPRGASTAADVFLGYLLLDAWIGNTDRHHENWGLILEPQPTVVYRLKLAPTYDHASSLGRNEPVERIRERLATKDRGFGVAGYAQKARSAFYRQRGDKTPMTPFEAFTEAATQLPDATVAWLERLAQVAMADVSRILSRIPSQRICPESAAFARELLGYNRTRLLEWGEGGC